jgi:hypothetical protein
MTFLAPQARPLDRSRHQRPPGDGQSLDLGEAVQERCRFVAGQRRSSNATQGRPEAFDCIFEPGEVRSTFLANHDPHRTEQLFDPSTSIRTLR